MSATTQTLCTVTFLLASTLTSATSAKCPWWLKWNASPSARPSAGIALPQPDRSATALMTFAARPVWNRPPNGSGRERRGSPMSSTRKST